MPKNAFLAKTRGRVNYAEITGSDLNQFHYYRSGLRIIVILATVSIEKNTVLETKEKEQEYLAKGWKLAESINESKTKVDSGFNIAGIEGDDDRVTGETGLQIARLKYLSNYQ